MDALTAASSRRRIVVVGGGAVGAAAAFLLARAGAEVTLLERDAIAAHASGRNAGNLNALHRTPPEVVPLALRALALHREIAADLARLGCAAYRLRPVRRVHLGLDEADRRDLAETARLYERTPGFGAEWLGREELARIEPRLSRDFEVAVATSGDLSVDGADLARSLAAGATRFGARIVREAATGVVACAGRVRSVRTAGGELPCDDVVLATGPWVSELGLWLGVDLPVEPVKGQLLLIRLPGGAPVCDFTWRTTALYRRRDDQLWLGGTMERCGFDAVPTTAARAELLERAARLMPAMTEAEVIDHVAALRPMTPSGAPIAARAAGWDNVVVANGGGMKGILLSVEIARTVRDLLLAAGTLASTCPATAGTE